MWYYYHKWLVFGVLKKLLYTLNQTLRLKQGREAEPSLVIVHSQSVKTPAFTGEEVGYDANKKLKGRKRHLALDSPGNVMAAGMTAVTVHDKTGARVLPKRWIVERTFPGSKTSAAWPKTMKKSSTWRKPCS